MEVIPARVFNLLYIYIDIIWLVILLIILLMSRRYMAAIAGAAGPRSDVKI